MKKLLKYLSLTLVLAIVLIAGTLYLLLNVMDPNRYRGPLQQLFADQTGLQLQIAGDISWSLRPSFGLSITDVRLRNEAARQELASIRSASLNLDPGALLRGELLLQELVAERLHINWYVDELGQSNWFIESDGTQPAAPAADRTDNELPIRIDIDLIAINDASISVRDRQQGIDLDLQSLNMQSRRSNLEGRPFPLTLNTRFVHNTGGRDLQLGLESQTRIHFDTGMLALDSLRLSMSPLVLEGELQVNDFHQQAQWQIALASNTFNLLYLLENFSDIDAGDGIDTSQHQLAMQLSARGDERGATINTLDIDLDGNALQFNADLLYATAQRPLTLAYNLQAEALNLDPYLPAAADSDDSAADSGDEELPFAALQDLTLRGEHQIGSLRVAGLHIEDINASLLIEDGRLSLQSRPMRLYGGALIISAAVDANSIPALVNSDLAIQGITTEALHDSVALLRPFTGALDMVAEHRLQGDTVNELLASINGVTELSLQQGTADITMVKRVFDAIAVLSPSGDMAAGWPDVIDFADAHARLTFTEGLASHQQLQLDIDNLEVTGTGGTDLAQNRFDYRLQFTILGEPAPQTILINEDYQGIAWPVRCNAGFDDSAARYCSPDLQQAREMFALVARDEIERRAREPGNDQSERLQQRASDLFDRLRQ